MAVLCMAAAAFGCTKAEDESPVTDRQEEEILRITLSLPGSEPDTRLSYEEVDFNELFDFIKLPDEIESVDYNKLVETFWSADTYKNLFQVSKVDVKYVTTSQGEIDKEVMEVTFSLNYDLQLVKLNTALTLKVEIDF